MKKHVVMLCIISFCAIPLFSTHADDNEDIFRGYNSDIKKTAEAKANNLYSAWANNNAYLIIHKVKKGLVIDEAGDYADGKVHADGVGNIVVDKDAKINGPIINNIKIDNTTIVNNPNNSNKRKRW